MGVKTRYREKPAQDIPASEKLNTPATETPVAPSKDVIKDAEKEAAASDEATARINQQLAHLHHSEQLQAQAQMQMRQQMQQRPMSHGVARSSKRGAGAECLMPTPPSSLIVP